MKLCFFANSGLSKIGVCLTHVGLIGIAIAFFISSSICFAALLTVPVQIITPEKNISVSAEVAVTPEQQATGLMYRTKMAENAGMIFIFEYGKIITMWMKNTYIPLDMIFFDEQGTITHIHKNAVPLDTSIISSQKPAIGVLEVNGGFADKYKIQSGDKLFFK